MKKVIYIILSALIMIMPFNISAMADDFNVTMAVGEGMAVVNGLETNITSPEFAFDKVFVDLYSVAPIFDMEVKWIPAEIGYFEVVSNNIYDFTLIERYDQLRYEKNKFFVKDKKIYVSLRDVFNISKYSGYSLRYDRGIITIGDISKNDIYKDVKINDCNKYFYETYPYDVDYVVNPYQVYSYENMKNDAGLLCKMYPDLIELSSIGKSVEGRDLTLIKFGKGNKKIFVCGTHHAREYISTTYLMYAIDRLSYSYKTGSKWEVYDPYYILNNVTFYIVPMVNPDGVNLVQNGVYATTCPEEISKMGIYESKQYGYKAWKTNVHGVDLNWNYNKDWMEERNKNSAGSTGFNGYYPRSEPETIAISDYVDKNSFDMYVSFHTQGEIFYWGQNEEKSDNTMIKIIYDDTHYPCYTDDGTGMGGSFFDYVYRNFKKTTLTFELCPYVGNYPYPDSDFDRVWKTSKNILPILGTYI